MEEILTMSRRVEKFNARLERSRWNLKRLQEKQTPVFVAFELLSFRDELHLMQSFIDSLLLTINKVKARGLVTEDGFQVDPAPLDLLVEASVEMRNAVGLEEKAAKREFLRITRNINLQN